MTPQRCPGRHNPLSGCEIAEFLDRRAGWHHQRVVAEVIAVGECDGVAPRSGGFDRRGSDVETPRCHLGKQPGEVRAHEADFQTQLGGDGKKQLVVEAAELPGGGDADVRRRVRQRADCQDAGLAESSASLFTELTVRHRVSCGRCPGRWLPSQSGLRAASSHFPTRPVRIGFGPLSRVPPTSGRTQSGLSRPVRAASRRDWRAGRRTAHHGHRIGRRRFGFFRARSHCGRRGHHCVASPAPASFSCRAAMAQAAGLTAIAPLAQRLGGARS